MGETAWKGHEPDPCGNREAMPDESVPSVAEVKLGDVLDVPSIQVMMDEFHALTGMGIGIIDLEGRILVATGWQDICTAFHRKHPETLRHCILSDTELSAGVSPGEFRIYRCANHLWDIATPIMLGDRHAGNLFLGQFLFEGEEPDREVFREQARKYGFDEAAYLDALDRLPRWSRERVRHCMGFYAAFARQISDLSYGNLKQARTLVQRDELLERLAENEERLRLALKATNDVVWDWDILRDTQRWNESGAEVFGWTDIVQAPQTAGWWVDRVHPEDRDRVEQGFFQAVRDPGVHRWSDRYRFRRADGSCADVEDRGYILRDGEGSAVRMIGAMLDVTERRRSEEALLRIRHLLDAAEELSGVGGWEWDVATGTMTWTEGTYRLHGFDPAEFPPGSSEPIERSLACYDPADRVRVEAAFHRCMETGEDYDLECDFTTATGRRLRVRTMGRAVREQNRVIRVVGNLQDITGPTRIQEELRASREAIQALLNATDDCVFLMDPEGRVLVHNLETARRMGCPGESLAGLRLYDMLPPEVAERRREWVSEVVRTGRPLREEDRRNGLILDNIVHPLFDEAGKVTRIAVFSRDITDQKAAEEALHRSEQSLKQAQKIGALGSWEWDIEGGKLTWSEELYRIWEVPPDFELTPENIMARIHPDDRETNEAVLKEMLESAEEIQFEFRIVRPDGGTRHLHQTAEVSRDPSGKAVRAFGVMQDITTQKQAMADLEFQAHLLRNIRDRVVATDLEGRITYVSESTCEMLGHTAEDLIGAHVGILGEDPDQGATQSDIVRRTLEEGAWHGEVFNIATGGERHLLDCRTWLVRDASGKPLGMVGVSTDITEKKRAEEALRESEERFRAANDASLDCLLLLRAERDGAGEIRDFVFVDLNRRAEEMLRMSREQLVGRRLCEALPINVEAGFFEKYRRVVETGEPLEEEFYLPETHVPAAWYYHQVVRVGDGVFIVHNDIGDRKRAEAERDQLQAQLLQAQKMESVGRLAGGVAHDFNNLLMGIMGYAELCRDEVGKDHPIRPWLDEILTQTHRSADLTRQLLAFARKQVLQPRNLDLNEQVGGLLRMLGRLIGEHIRLSWSPGPGLRLVRVDPAHIDQVLANLCVNAADAIEGTGRVSISTRNTVLDEMDCAGMPESEPGAYVQLIVADDGCGMDPETREHAFEPFFTTKGLGRGTGLGLATVYGIVKQSGGHVRIDSTPGQGTRVSVYLPALPEEAVPIPPDVVTGSLQGGHETILVVDDERTIRETTTLQLQGLGYNVLTAGSPETALRLARERSDTIDLLITDIVMPGMSGIELRDRILADRPGMKTILITGYATAGLDEEDLGEGSTVRLMKPVPLRKLAVATRTLLDSRNGV